MTVRHMEFDAVAHSHRLQLFLEDTDLHNRARAQLQQWAGQGYLAASDADSGKLFKKHQTSMALTPSLLATPHPSVALDFGGLLFAAQIFYAEVLDLVVASCMDPDFSIADIEIMIMSLSQSPEYPQFSRNAREMGLANAFINLLPLMHHLRHAPLFDFETSACEEVTMFDIKKGIDSSYFRAPHSLCYFHLDGSMGHTVHDAETGFHPLAGFYINEKEPSPYSLNSAIKLGLGLDPALPFRYLSVVLVGEPIGHLGNDTVTKIDVFLQDGMDIDLVVENTTKWYLGEVDETSDKPIDATLNLADHTKSKNVGGVDSRHNIALLPVVINCLAYLNFADFRRRETKERSALTAQIMKKSLSNQKKTLKKVRGKSDRIIISSNNKLFEQSASNEGGYKVSPHFRRGHIRNQRYGAADDVHFKPLFIAPTMVAQKQDDEVVIPKSYSVK